MSISAQYPGAPALSDFLITSEANFNPAWPDTLVAGYKAEMASVTSDCPSASGVYDWGTWDTLVYNTMTQLFPLTGLSPATNEGTIGRRECFRDAAVYEWLYNPLGGHLSQP